MLTLFFFLFVVRGLRICFGPHAWSCVFCFLCLGFWRRSVAEFSNRDDMTRAVRELDDTYFGDRRIRVDYVSTSVMPLPASLEVKLLLWKWCSSLGRTRRQYGECCWCGCGICSRGVHTDAYIVCIRRGWFASDCTSECGDFSFITCVFIFSFPVYVAISLDPILTACSVLASVLNIAGRSRQQPRPL